ncbi:hypothetical protein BCR34DRAFT_600113 [Clohesyomyces aquaticus]|uniref:Tubby C-terminal-like domain-containing protein n=1 Tax=Clohesyomyces aquaticus TaxID=1231657 RepID=A0A1Y1ZSJ9_9PLEO|nr:hypothetical protein BCR34DRAFT_600113 [Clohesyomyces aquaticus]
MSTSIALQDLHPSGSPTQQAGTVRRRHTSADSDAYSDRFLSQHDLASPSPETHIDSQAFNPTHTYWISPHGSLAKEIKILDLTPFITLPYTGLTPAYKDHIKKTLKDHSYSPVYMVQRNNWWSLKYKVTSDTRTVTGDEPSKTIAEWKHPWHSGGEAILSFPLDSQNCTHPISLKNKRFGFSTETFTLESRPFIWKKDTCWNYQDMTLYKVFGSGKQERRVEVAKYAQKWWGGWVTGGTLVVDEKEVDGLVACLTLMVVLKKRRQRQAERSGGGGGNGGG